MVAACDTIWPADSVEFCPDSPRNIFVCGTYKLDQPDEPLKTSTEDPTQELDSSLEPLKKQQRRGKCLVFEVVSNHKQEFHKLQEICLPAVLDMKWCHRIPSATPLLGIADSEGNVTIEEWSDEERQLKSTQSISCASSETLCLSLDWSNRRSPTNHLGSLIVSLSDGRLCLLQPRDQTGLLVTDSWTAHDYEPWIAAWNYWDTNMIYSGGDDLKMKAWDTRQGFDEPLFTNKRFDAGITAIQSHPHIEHLLAVGSYDNTVRLFDVRKPLVPLAQADVGGGAWRVKWHPSAHRKDDLLVACMHDGFKVVRFDTDGLLNRQGRSNSDSKNWNVVKRFDDHESLAYGVDWSFDSEIGTNKAEAGSLIASGSFYDCSLRLWSG